MAKYKLQSNGVRRDDGACVPPDESNRDWQEYQEWLAIEGNTPDPEFTEQEIADNRMASIRAQRDVKLLKSDFTQLPDCPLTTEQKAAWAVYRQALRDFPAACDPANPTWPVEPA